MIGATGLVGRQLVELLLMDSRFGLVKIFTRRNSGLSHKKLEEHVVDFEDVPGWKKLVTGDVLYSAMGTTLRKAGNKDNQYKVDHNYQYQVARAAAGNNVKEYVLVSSAGADPGSKIFYSKMKGELERDVKKLPFEAIHILRPGILSGARREVRVGEKIGVGVMRLLSAIPGLGNFKPVGGREVARAMINATFRHIVGIHTYSMGAVLKLADQMNVLSTSRSS